MEWLILLVSLVILVETTILLLQKRTTRRSGTRKIYVDTSALIDGRVVNVARTGFLNGDLIILHSVLRELQLLADGKDSEKRIRARAGLSNVAELERVPEVNVIIYNDGDGRKKVDEELLRFARENKGVVLTIDYNLIKVAEAEKIEVLNVNELALAVRTELVPGERTKIKITDKGSNRGQGVGHLPDGTMVIIENAVNRVGQELLVEFIRFHETPSGRIVFGRIVKEER